ncbi:MAG: 2-dehydropantoate 2-reductase [Candidatus Rokuibacteriota bacterium]|nr:MAG: 2-dehydropantoate 2-reductase [Candidatus Rokubacteria bacterium]
MKLVVMGAGGVGGYFGGKLQRRGTAVTFVARGAHLEALRRRGLTIRSATEGEWSAPATAVEHLAGQPTADAVLLCVKSFDTEEAVEAIRPVVGPDTAVLSLQNGVDNEAKIDAALGAGHAVGGVAYVFATIEGPGVIAHTQGGRIVLGELDGQARPRTERLREALTAAGVPTELSPDIRRALWDKYLAITAQAGMTALTRKPVGVIRATPECWTLFRLLLEELAAIAAAEKVGLAPDVVERILTGVSGLKPDTTSSMYYDLTHGKRLELEALQGHALRLAERHGLPSPTLFAVYAALKPHAGPA